MSRSWLTTEDDGRLRWRVHQSALSESDICLERVRFGMAGDIIDGPSDATAVGTAMHAGIEACLDSMIAGDGPLAAVDVLHIALSEFEDLILEPGFRWVKRKRAGAEAYLTKAVVAWYQQVLPNLVPVATEVPFGPYTIYEDLSIIIEVAGTIDYVDANLGLVDWKSGSAHSWRGKGWEKQRWAIQPTVYSYGYERLLNEKGQTLLGKPIPFTYFVMLDDGTVHTEQVTRTSRDWLWLQDKVKALAPLVMSDLPTWPKQDNHALCSAKWCPYWTACKGRSVEDHDDLPDVDDWRATT